MTRAEKLLVISSDPAFGDVRKDVLEAAGFSVISANNFRQAGLKRPAFGYYPLRPDHSQPLSRLVVVIACVSF
jgi:hypothetical protein